MVDKSSCHFLNNGQSFVILLRDVKISVHVHRRKHDCVKFLWVALYIIEAKIAKTYLCPYRILYNQGSIHSTFVHSISNSTVYHLYIDSINALFFVPVVWWQKCHVFDIIWYLMSNKMQFRHQTTGTKINALIESILKWSTVEFKMEWTKVLWIDPNFIN